MRFNLNRINFKNKLIIKLFLLEIAYGVWLCFFFLIYGVFIDALPSSIFLQLLILIFFFGGLITKTALTLITVWWGLKPGPPRLGEAGNLGSDELYLA
jgi:hypothetical protein